MISNVKASDIRDRLRVLSSLEITDDLIESNAYLPSADAYLEKLLDINGDNYNNLSDSEKLLADQIVIAMTCKKLIMSAPLPGLEAGPIKIKPVTADEKKEICSELQAEIDQALDIFGWAVWVGFGSYYTSDNYVPDAEDRTNLLFFDEESSSDISFWS